MKMFIYLLIIFFIFLLGYQIYYEFKNNDSSVLPFNPSRNTYSIVEGFNNLEGMTGSTGTGSTGSTNVNVNLSSQPKTLSSKVNMLQNQLDSLQNQVTKNTTSIQGNTTAINNLTKQQAAPATNVSNNFSGTGASSVSSSLNSYPSTTSSTS
jgi:hypothetical protein